jgi:hypoxia-inducible factor prolyl 4-hydroxylase
MFRQSNQTWLKQGPQSSAFLQTLKQRVQEVVKLPKFIVQESEQLQVVQYYDGGHYHTHHDSTEYTPRYLTLLYYLTDVEEGGETAFPMADTNVTTWNEEGLTPEGWGGITYTAEDKWNLSYTANCHRSVYVKPTKGKAILWYTHLSASCPTGQEKGCKLGPLDPFSLHGGCDVHKGIKWIANNWINVAADKKGWPNPVVVTRTKVGDNSKAGGGGEMLVVPAPEPKEGGAVDSANDHIQYLDAAAKEEVAASRLSRRKGKWSPLGGLHMHSEA